MYISTSTPPYQNLLILISPSKFPFYKKTKQRKIPYYPLKISHLSLRRWYTTTFPSVYKTCYTAHLSLSLTPQLLLPSRSYFSLLLSLHISLYEHHTFLSSLISIINKRNSCICFLWRSEGGKEEEEEKGVLYVSKL